MAQEEARQAMKANIQIAFDVTIDMDEAGDTVITVEGTHINGTGRNLEQAAGNLRATMLSRLANLKRREPKV